MTKQKNISKGINQVTKDIPKGINQSAKHLVSTGFQGLPEAITEDNPRDKPPSLPIVAYSLLDFCRLTEGAILDGYRFDLESTDNAPLNYFNSGIFQCTMVVLPESTSKPNTPAFTFEMPKL